AEHEKMEQRILEQPDQHDTPTPPGRAALSTAREAGDKATARSSAFAGTRKNWSPARAPGSESRGGDQDKSSATKCCPAPRRTRSSARPSARRAASSAAVTSSTESTR